MRENAFIFGYIPENCHIVNISDGDELNFGNLSFKVISTPGHSPGGVCFSSGKILFCGDTLFNSSFGRTDLPGGNYETLINSIINKLLCLDVDTVAYSGHGPYTTIGSEKTHYRF